MELVALLQKKNKVSRHRNANMRIMASGRGGASSSSVNINNGNASVAPAAQDKHAAKVAAAQMEEQQAEQSFREHVVHSKLMLLQQEVMRRAAVATKETELEQQLDKRTQLLTQLTNLVGARQKLAEEGLGDITNADGSPPVRRPYAAVRAS
jgi:hypothetical protein